MLFAVMYSQRAAANEEEMRIVYRRFMSWEPPERLSIRFHYVYAAGGRGLAVVDAPEAGLIREATVPFCGALDFELNPSSARRRLWRSRSRSWIHPTPSEPDLKRLTCVAKPL